ncbi:MAG: 2-oxo acid dehydrogenase subunit E2 [Alphaproteobacteria bacterium]|nr:2-oxo acid dehydrogenase subunit E2 [Alphaproteobacteria bacterium]
MSQPDPIGVYTAAKPPFLRRLTMEAFDAIPPGHQMFALLELDVTDTLAAIRAQQEAGARVTLFAFVVQAIAATLAAHPSLNALRSGARIFTFEDVDVSVPIELKTKSGPFPHQIVIRRAQDKTAAEIYGEIEAARSQQANSGVAGGEDRWGRAMMRALLWVPKAARNAALRQVMQAPRTVKRRSGTTFVTSVSRFATAGGFVVPYIGGPKATAFALGSVLEKPRVVDGEIRVRSVLSLTVAFNHDLVDGGPAARFVRDLQARVEGAEGLA